MCSYVPLPGKVDVGHQEEFLPGRGDQPLDQTAQVESMSLEEFKELFDMFRQRLDSMISNVLSNIIESGIL